MSRNIHDIDDLFKSAIEEHIEMPSQQVWDAIDKNLDKNDADKIKKKYSSLKRLSILLALLLIGSSSYFIYTNLNEGSDKTSDNMNVANKIMNEKPSGENKSGNTINQANKQSVNNKIKDNSSITDIVKTYKAPASTNSHKLNDAELVNENINVYEQPAKPHRKDVAKKNLKQKIKVSITPGSVGSEDADEPIAESDLPNNLIENNSLPSDTSMSEKATEEIVSGSKDELKQNDKSTSPIIKNSSVAENKTPGKTKSAHHWSVLPFYSPQYGFSNVQDDYENEDMDDEDEDAEDIKEGEQNQQSFSCGILVNYSVSKKWGVQSGINYLSRETTIEPKKVFAKEDGNGDVKYRLNFSSGYTYLSPKTGTNIAVGDSTNLTQSNSKLEFIGVPVGVYYYFNSGKFTFNPAIGINTNFLIKQTIETAFEDGNALDKQSTDKINGVKNVSFSSYASFGIDYNLNKRIALSIAPTLNIALSSITKNNLVKSYPNSVGLMGGIKIKF